MKNLFVSYELALQLKEKGFNEPCFWFYRSSDKELIQPINNESHKQSFYQKNSTRSVLFGVEWDFTAPLYQQVFDWFRETHQIRFKIEPTINDKVEIFIYQVGWKFVGKFSDDYEAYDKAIEEALKRI